ncbi:hypothetical protein [Micromonospora sp. NPDC005254]|uniref:hypothetical protein n=1 Tax=Micromonospora sp. NPDC005254 TaxID=3364229 RepID=UPI003691A5FF
MNGVQLNSQAASKVDEADLARLAVARAIGAAGDDPLLAATASNRCGLGAARVGP